MQRNLTHQLAHELGQMIVKGRYNADNPLPSEAEICTAFGVSRSATREAVKMLSAKGLLSSRPRQGIRVRPESDWNLFDADVLEWLLHSHPTPDLLLEFTQMRAATEPEAARLAATQASQDGIDAIAQAWNRLVAASKGRDDPLDSDIAFHNAVLRASGNRFFSQMCAFTETALRVTIRFTNAAKGVAVADVDAHRVILDAIREGDGELAAAATAGLLDEAQTLIRQEIALAENDGGYRQ